MTRRVQEPDPDVGRAWALLGVLAFLVLAAITALRYCVHHCPEGF